MNKANDIGTDIFTIQGRIITAIVDTRDEQTIKEIKEYFKNKYKNEYVDTALLDEKKVEEIIKLGIAEYKRRYRNITSNKRKSKGAKMDK